MQIPPSREAIAAEVRGLRAKRRMTVQALGDAIGMSRQSMTAYLNGERAFTVEQLERVADALGADLLELLAVA